MRNIICGNNLIGYFYPEYKEGSLPGNDHYSSDWLCFWYSGLGGLRKSSVPSDKLDIIFRFETPIVDKMYLSHATSFDLIKGIFPGELSSEQLRFISTLAFNDFVLEGIMSKALLTVDGSVIKIDRIRPSKIEQLMKK
jgi:hypothetical protein